MSRKLMKMKTVGIILRLSVLVYLFCALSAKAQVTRTFNTTGSWSTGSNWSGGNIADDVNDDVAFASGATKTASIGSSYTVGNINLDKHALNITSTLNVGDASNSRSVSAGNGASVTVSGTLIIWGDVNVGNSMSWTISGTVIIKGSVNLGNGASFTVSGNLSVDKDFIAGNNTTVVNSGNITVTGDVKVGGGTTSLTNSGTFKAGTCTETSGNVPFCENVILPVTLTYFGATIDDSNAVKLNWTTAMEKNFQKFLVQRSANGVVFENIGELAGQGFDLYNIESKYSYTDLVPLLGLNYYRLVAIDLDGEFEVFHTVATRVQGTKNVVVYPNPSRADQVSFRTNFSHGEDDTISILDAVGHVVFHGLASEVGSVIKPEIELNPGVYFLIYKNSQLKVVNRFSIR